MTASPCTEACRIDPDTGICRGRLRTLGEIARWGGADDEEKDRILAAVPERRARARAGESATTARPE